MVHRVGVRVSYSPENEQLIGLLLVHNEVLSRDDRQQVLVLRDLHTDDLIRFPFFGDHQRDLNFALSNFFELFSVKELDPVNLTDQESIHSLDWQAPLSIQVVLRDSVDLVIVLILPTVDVERGGVRLECNSVLDFGPEHHLRAIHEIEHYVL